MGYIIVWNPGSRDPFLQTGSWDKLEEYMFYDEAKKEADKNIDNEHFRRYAIFEEVTS